MAAPVLSSGWETSVPGSILPVVPEDQRGGQPMRTVGDWVGDCDGENVGDCVGDWVGEDVGLDDGLNVGGAVGELVGKLDGVWALVARGITAIIVKVAESALVRMMPRQRFMMLLLY